MKIKIQTKQIVEEEVDVQLPLFWSFDNIVSKLEYTKGFKEQYPTIQLTSVTYNSITKTLMSVEQFCSYYSHYRTLYSDITQEEFESKYNELNQHMR